MAKVELKIVGKPQGKQRPKFSRRGKYVTTYTPDQTVSYENYVKLCWMQSGAEKLNGNIKATVKAHFKIPASVSKKKHAELKNSFYSHKPDADNLAKIILDSLNGGLAYDDDAQVVWLEVCKVYDDEEFVVLTLEEITDENLSEL